ncbi:TetR/AcrR family transcriptional regulator [Phenylobacterium sp.]|uniref:TetR/AcrR family transcriptional regulator n=1 Tax=Phenylobacterium sp. TaxID=1871053 RepID=UPI0035B075F0
MAAEPRRRPKQERSKATETAVLEAAAQILEEAGEAGFNTNRVAERAGVSIGSLYQYFPNKQAILVALSRREVGRMRERMAAEIAGAADPVRVIIHRQIHAFEGRPTLRKAVVRAAMAEESARALGGETDRTRALLPPIEGLTRTEAYAISRAVIGAIRAAVLEERPELYEPEFEEALMTLVDGVRALAAARSAAA